MKNRVTKIILILLLIIPFVVFVQLVYYFYIQHSNEKAISVCSQTNERCDLNVNIHTDNQQSEFYKNSESVFENADSCYCKMYDLLLPRLLVYKVTTDNKPLKFLRVSWDSYIVPITAMEKADAIITYGILNDILFEDNISRIYQKKLYTYDCGVQSIEHLTDNNPYITFGSECIGTDNFILKEFGQISSNRVHSFGQKLKELNLENKKVYLKMDIAGAEIEVLPDIVNYSDNLTGMSIVIRAFDTERLIKFNQILKMIEKDFVLVARNGIRAESYSGSKCRYVTDEISSVISLTYINKNLVDKKYLPLRQDYHQAENYITKNGNYTVMPSFKISGIVPLAERIKGFFNTNENN